jgi:hypothetical protein
MPTALTWQTMSEPFGGMPTRWDPDPGPSSRVAVVLPGSGYSPAHPLLEFGRQSLLEHGWTVQQVWWDQPRDLQDRGDTSEWVCQQATVVLDAEADADRLLVLAKSLGTLASPVVAGRGLDAIWMTPLFSSADSIEAIRAGAATGAHQLLVGGLSDPEWDSERANELATKEAGIEVAEFADATHFMHVPDNALRSVEIQSEVSRAVDTFLTQIAR